MKKYVKKIWICMLVMLLGVVALSTPVEAAGKTTTRKKAVYTIKTYKASYKGKKIKAQYRYDLPKLKGKSKVVKKINASLKKQYDPKAKADLITTAKENEKYLPYKESWYDVTKCKASYNKNGYISFKYSSKWYIGGICNVWTYGQTYSLKTGKKLTVADVIPGNKKQVKQKIIRAFSKQVDNSDIHKVALEGTKIKDSNFPQEIYPRILAFTWATRLIVPLLTFHPKYDCPTVFRHRSYPGSITFE